jgi:polysaccharide deacetylase family protein (PEP-CTERM system associated)
MNASFNDDAASCQSQLARSREQLHCSSTAMILSIDVEEHHRIEAGAHLSIDASLKSAYHERMVGTTSWLLDRLDSAGIKATFFLVAEIAAISPALVRRIHASGHEVASHSWAHARIHRLSPSQFREDSRRSKDILEQTIGCAVLGYRAPTFSIVKETGWAVDILAELGFQYDSSIYPIRHDRYGVPDAPAGPFLLRGTHREILEIPPATLRMARINVPIGGGGYFRLIPWPIMRHALAQARRDPRTGSYAMLYFHPWEFDATQPRLPLSRANRFRTYVGIKRTRSRLMSLFCNGPFVRACDAACHLMQNQAILSTYQIH